MTMKPEDYQIAAARTLISGPDFKIHDNEMMIIWTALGLTGEAGEVAELAKKGILHQHGIDVIKFADEIGDCLWYIASLCTVLGLDLGEVMQANIEKLLIRYPNGFNSEDSKNRKDVNNRN